MTRADLTLALIKAGYYRGQWELDDIAFDAFSRDFVERAWAAWVESLPPELKEQRHIGGGKTIAVPKHIPEVWDCDNQVRDFAVFVTRCLAVDAIASGRARGNAAGGIFKFLRATDPLQAHARFWFVDYEMTVNPFDVGVGQFGLTSAENETIFGGGSV